MRDSEYYFAINCFSSSFYFLKNLFVSSLSANITTYNDILQQQNPNIFFALKYKNPNPTTLTNKEIEIMLTQRLRFYQCYISDKRKYLQRPTEVALNKYLLIIATIPVSWMYFTNGLNQYIGFIKPTDLLHRFTIKRKL